MVWPEGGGASPNGPPLNTPLNVCSLFTLQFCSLLHFRRSIALVPAFSTPYKGLEKVKVWTLAIAPFTSVRLVTSSALQSRK